MKNLFKITLSIMLALMFVIPAVQAADRANFSVNKLTVDSIAPITGKSVDITGTGIITATNVADAVHVVNFNLAAGTQDGGADMDEASTPTLGTVDNVPALVYDDSSEVDPVQWTVHLPTNYVSGLTFYAMISSDDNDGTKNKLDWDLTVNKDGTAFGTVLAQDVVAGTETALATKNDVLTFTPDATAVAAFAAGANVTLGLFNASTHSSAKTTEIKAVWAEMLLAQ